MTYAFDNVKKVVVLGSAVFAVAAIPALLSRDTSFDLGVITSAQAQEDHAASKKGTGAGNKGPGAGQGIGTGKANGGTAQGSKSVESLLKGGSTTGGKSATGKGGPTDESDAPIWAGVKGGKSGGGGKPADGGTKKGDLFGDLYVLVRNPVTGAALTETIGGVVYPLVQAYIKLPDGTLQAVAGSIPRDPATGDLLPTMLIGGVPTAVFPSEVEFSRLSVARSPTKVLDHSLAEAVTKLTTTGVIVTQDAAGRLVITGTDGVAKTIDSPLENLALYKAIMALPAGSTTITVLVSSEGGKTSTPVSYTIPTTVNLDMLKASLLAAAADKTKTVSLDVVMYINSILKVAPDLSTFTYDRLATYGSATALVLVETSPGIFEPKTVNLYDTLFKVNDTAATGAADFAQATDDALQILEFVHDNAVR